MPVEAGFELDATHIAELVIEDQLRCYFKIALVGGRYRSPPGSDNKTSAVAGPQRHFPANEPIVQNLRGSRPGLGNIGKESVTPGIANIQKAIAPRQR